MRQIVCQRSAKSKSNQRKKIRDDPMAEFSESQLLLNRRETRMTTDVMSQRDKKVKCVSRMVEMLKCRT